MKKSKHRDTLLFGFSVKGKRASIKLNNLALDMLLLVRHWGNLCRLMHFFYLPFRMESCDRTKIRNGRLSVETVLPVIKIFLCDFHREQWSEAAVQRCCKFTEEHPCRSAISIKLLCTSAWLFSCKFIAYFQNTFSWKHLLAAAFQSSNM